MLINKKSAGLLRERLKTSGKTGKVFCSGLFLSARWFVFSSVAESGMHLIVLPDKDSAEYCASDLYYLTDGDRVFFLPDTGKKIERSNYKASLEVQRTSALEKIMKSGNSGELAVIVTYPAALEEKIPEVSEIRKAVISIRKGEDVKHEVLCERLSESGFSRVDFVSEPGQYAVRGGLIDIFSYSFNNPFRISFFGSEVESISVFNCNTQLSENTVDYVDIYPELAGSDSEDGRPVTDLFGDDTVVWLDSSDMYMNSVFFPELKRFRQVYIDTPLSLGLQDEDIVRLRVYRRHGRGVYIEPPGEFRIVPVLSIYYIALHHPAHIYGYDVIRHDIADKRRIIRHVSRILEFHYIGPGSHRSRTAVGLDIISVDCHIPLPRLRVPCSHVHSDGLRFGKVKIDPVGINGRVDIDSAISCKSLCLYKPEFRHFFRFIIKSSHNAFLTRREQHQCRSRHKKYHSRSFPDAIHLSWTVK